MVHPLRRSVTTSPLREASFSRFEASAFSVFRESVCAWVYAPALGSWSLLRMDRSPRPTADPIISWLAPEVDGVASENYVRLLESCVRKFIDARRYRDDIRFIKILVLYGDAIQDFKMVFELMEEKGVGLRCSLMYEAYAIFLANTEPIGRLKKIHALFLNHVTSIEEHPRKYQYQRSQIIGLDIDLHILFLTFILQKHAFVNPWSASTINDLLKKINHHIAKHNGYCKSSKAYQGKVKLSSLQNSSRNKIIDLGGKKYQIKGCSGQGGFAQVFKAYVDNNPEIVVALKIQKPAFPWEFYMYRQLDMRIPDNERSSFGVAHGIYLYSDWSVLVTDYLSHGTLQDAINSYLVMQKHMEEVLCIFYTIEMLHILETLHSVGIIHGDFKPDNLLIRYVSDELTDDGFQCRTGSWRGQGLCLVDWGRGIDLNLFPSGTQFVGDCRTSGFRCIEMQEDKPWTFQVDTYGLCVIIHMMLHGSYMSIEKKGNSDGDYTYQPRSSLKNTCLCGNLFSTLLNRRSNDNDVAVLQSLRKSFEDFMLQSPQLVKKLKELLAKQRASLCAA
ncbi:unnamed protein product [Spirodela intermedia]|uniref:Uncharacterized protein n=1 Tax=Spirodela intermedia TaxID=51605 RepID=A0A7I8JPA3_SPIIN|nr:unnamed protein product [Spirodela intermedia]CAA6671989.1 unnamed protein product [Spirodela intermedia]